MKNNHITKLVIDLNAAKYNLNYFKSKLQENTKILVVVKAFGYGSDAVEVAKHLEKQVDYFAVAYTDEGVALRNAGIKISILVFHPQVVNFELIISHSLEPNIYNARVFKDFISIAKKHHLTNYPIHLTFNTGLNRLGFEAGDIHFIASEIKKNATIKVLSIFSHLSASEDKNERDFTISQITAFEKINYDFQKIVNQKPIMHLCNTSGIENYPQAHFDMVRLGIGLYGFGNDAKVTSKLKNVVSLKTIISQIHTIKKGESVGYNRAFIANKNMKIATLPIGYADGISRIWSKGIGFAFVNNQKTPIIGNVSMDMIMVDITDINCNEGDEVIVFDNQQTVEELAQNSKTISYEIITTISQRVKREILY